MFKLVSAYFIKLFQTFQIKFFYQFIARKKEKEKNEKIKIQFF